MVQGGKTKCPVGLAKFQEMKKSMKKATDYSDRMSLGKRARDDGLTQTKLYVNTAVGKFPDRKLK